MGDEDNYKELDEIYYNSQDPGSYGGVNRLLLQAKERGLKNITPDKIRENLAKQHSYTLHKPARKRFSRNKTIVGSIDKQWQADLADMQGLADDNDKYRYLLTVIDIFSKFAWVAPLKDKTGKNIVDAFSHILKQAYPRKPLKLQTDAGKEFLNHNFQSFLKRNLIHHFTAPSDTKASVVERFNRTLKSPIWTYFTAKQSHRYIEVLPKIVKSYNHSFHRTIGMKPADVRKKDVPRLFKRMFPERSVKHNGKKLKRGDMVRVSKVKGNFEKGYMPNWSEEHFLVDSQKPGPRPVYKLKDKMGEEIKGVWYPEEVQRISKNRYYIEKVLKNRKVGRRKPEVLVKWKGWPEKFNSWIPADDIEYVS